jgi:hypothetical protein
VEEKDVGLLKGKIKIPVLNQRELRLLRTEEA